MWKQSLGHLYDLVGNVVCIQITTTAFKILSYRCSYHTKGKPNAKCIKKKYNLYIRIIPTAANDLSTLNIRFFHDYENLCLATQCQCRNNYMLGVCGLEQLRSQYIFTRTVVPSVSIVIDKYRYVDASELKFPNRYICHLVTTV